MKKIVAAAALTAAITAMASAEINFGIWGRALWNVAANEGDGKVVTDVHQSWGGAAPRIGLSVGADTENGGFKFEIFNNGTGFGQGDNAYAYVSPVDGLKVYVGKRDINELRGDAAFGLWNWDRLSRNKGAVGNKNGVESEGWIFPDLLDGNGVGAVYKLDSLGAEGATLGVSVPLGLSNADYKRFSDAWGHGAAYVGAYSIPDTVTFKLGVKTLPRLKKVDKTEGTNAVKIHAAVEVSAVENAFFALGAHIPTVSGQYYSKGDNGGAYGTSVNQYNPVVTLYGKYNIDAFTPHLIAGFSINSADSKTEDASKKKTDGEFGFVVGGGVDCNLSNFVEAEGLSAFVDVRYANGIWASNDSSKNMDNLTFGLGINKSWSNASLGIAFEGTTNNSGWYDIKDSNGLIKADAFAWEVPVKFEYRF